MVSGLELQLFDTMESCGVSPLLTFTERADLYGSHFLVMGGGAGGGINSSFKVQFCESFPFGHVFLVGG